jgi:GT2 family glycosyltransferase
MKNSKNNMLLKHSIQIILVLYKTKLKDSLSFKTLCEYISVLLYDYELLIYNNSPEIIIEENKNYVLINAKQNEMLVGAYNFALHRAIECKRNWLLLLDQDTCLTKEYFEQLNIALASNENVAAIIPKLRYKQVHLSPKSCNPFFGHWGIMIDLKETGIIKNKTLQAFNTATLLLVKALQNVDGFPQEFPLYELDYCLFYRLSKNHEKFYIMNVYLSHDLTMLDYRNKMTIERYILIIGSEYRFAKQLGVFAFLTFKMRLIFRFFKQLLVEEKRKYTKLTVKYLLKA